MRRQLRRCPSAEAVAGFRLASGRAAVLCVQLLPATQVRHRVQRVSVDAGFTCPNVDGTVATGGCTFCDNRSFSPSRRLPRRTICEQIDEGIRRMRGRYDCEHFMAYFPAGDEHLRAGRSAAAGVRASTRASPHRRSGDRHAAGLRAGRRAGLARRTSPSARSCPWNTGCRRCTIGRWTG